MSRTPDKPIVLLVGGPDVDARIDLMQALRNEFRMWAAGSSPHLAPHFAQAGLDYCFYPLDRGSNPFMDIYTCVSLWRMLRRLRPQIVHTFDTKPGVWGALAARLAGAPGIIVTLTGVGGALYLNDRLSTRIIRAIYLSLQRLACRAADLTMFQNHDDARQFTSAGFVTARSALVIPGSGVATTVFAPSNVTESARMRVRAELGLQPGELVVTMVSRVIRQKGVLEFTAAAREIRARYPHVRFLLVGPDDVESVGRLTAAELVALQESVIWPGPRRDIPAVLALSDVFVLPSAYREGIPRVLLEAASMGLPIVTTDSPGCNEVVEHGVNGLLVPTHDAAALTEAVLRLIERPDLCQRFGRAARQRAVERFDITVVVDRTRAAYQALLAAGG